MEGKVSIYSNDTKYLLVSDKDAHMVGVSERLRS